MAAAHWRFKWPTGNGVAVIPNDHIYKDAKEIIFQEMA